MRVRAKGLDEGGGRGSCGSDEAIWGRMVERGKNGGDKGLTIGGGIR